MITGHQLRLLRHLHYLNQEAIAKKLQITQQAYSKMEHQQVIKGERLNRLIEALGYTKGEFEIVIASLPIPVTSF